MCTGIHHAIYESGEFQIWLAKSSFLKTLNVSSWFSSFYIEVSWKTCRLYKNEHWQLLALILMSWIQKYVFYLYYSSTYRLEPSSCYDPTKGCPASKQMGAHSAPVQALGCIVQDVLHGLLGLLPCAALLLQEQHEPAFLTTAEQACNMWAAQAPPLQSSIRPSPATPTVWERPPPTQLLLLLLCKRYETLPEPSCTGSPPPPPSA